MVSEAVLDGGKLLNSCDIITVQVGCPLHLRESPSPLRCSDTIAEISAPLFPAERNKELIKSIAVCAGSGSSILNGVKADVCKLHRGCIICFCIRYE